MATKQVIFQQALKSPYGEFQSYLEKHAIITEKILGVNQGFYIFVIY